MLLEVFERCIDARRVGEVAPAIESARDKLVSILNGMMTEKRILCIYSSHRDSPQGVAMR
jgi:hypothetical protein